MNQSQPSREAVAERAYLLWEQAGKPLGRDEEFWLRAEAELTTAASGGGVPPVIAPPTIALQSAPSTQAIHQLPPPIQAAVQSPGPRPRRPRPPKRA